MPPTDQQTDDRSSVLFVCTHNSSRSQMAEGLLRSYLGDRFLSRSAGTEPGGVNPFAIKAMEELGIDISGHTSDHVDQYANRTFDYVVTVCDHAREHCPYVPAKVKNFHHPFKDPSATTGSDEEKLEAFRRAREEIKQWILTTWGNG